MTQSVKSVSSRFKVNKWAHQANKQTQIFMVLKSLPRHGARMNFYFSWTMLFLLDKYLIFKLTYMYLKFKLIFLKAIDYQVQDWLQLLKFYQKRWFERKHANLVG
jgi:hypothetical protein